MKKLYAELRCYTKNTQSYLCRHAKMAKCEKKNIDVLISQCYNPTLPPKEEKRRPKNLRFLIPKNKLCKRNNRQVSDNTKIAAKQGNAEERPDAGFIGEKTYDEISQLDARSYVITEDNAAIDQSAYDYIDFFENMYSQLKAPFFDKQILVVTAKDSYSLYARAFQQDVVIEQVIEGNIGSEGKTVQMLFAGGFYYETPEECENRVSHSSYFNQKLSQDDVRQQFIFDMAGLNVMKPEHKYLVFAQSIKFDNYLMLCADKHQFTWFDISATDTKVMTSASFFDYKDNEIFTDSEVVSEDFYRLKKEVLAHYGIDAG